MFSDKSGPPTKRLKQAYFVIVTIAKKSGKGKTISHMVKAHVSIFCLPTVQSGASSHC